MKCRRLCRGAHPGLLIKAVAEPFQARRQIRGEAGKSLPTRVFQQAHPAPWPTKGVDDVLDAPLSDEDKIAILGGNLATLLKIPAEA